MRGEWYTIVTMPLAYWVWSVNIYHDATHFALSWNWKINKIMTNIGFMFCTPYIWYHQHVIGHHIFPNIEGKDPDLYHAPRFIRHSKDLKLKKPHTYQTISFVLTWLIGVPAGLIVLGVKQAFTRPNFNRTVTFGNNKYLNKDSLKARLAFYFFVIHIVPFILHGLTIKGLLFSIIPIYLFSVCFMICSQINHLTPHTTEQFSNNFFIHQVLTAHDVATDNYLVYLFTGGLNLQIEHHLFPSVNHCHLRKLQPHVIQICKKYGVKYSESPTIWGALCEHV
jgi:fatty acid desaturase